MSIDSKKTGPLVLLQSAPYDGSLARSGLDLALSLAVFAQDPVLLFSGDAVLSLKAQQDPSALGKKSLRKVIDSLPLYDVDKIFVDAASLAKRGMTVHDLPPFAVTVSGRELNKLIRETDHVISL